MKKYKVALQATHEIEVMADDEDEAHEKAMATEITEICDISSQEWVKAYEHAIFYLGLYSMFQTGMFGALTIKGLIRRYENGERTQELYEEMIGIE